MKKFIAVFAAFLMVAALCGCAAKEANVSPVDAGKTAVNAEVAALIEGKNLVAAEPEAEPEQVAEICENNCEKQGKCEMKAEKNCGGCKKSEKTENTGCKMSGGCKKSGGCQMGEKSCGGCKKNGGCKKTAQPAE